jgi:hypothetical protein
VLLVRLGAIHRALPENTVPDGILESVKTLFWTVFQKEHFSRTISWTSAIARYARVCDLIFAESSRQGRRSVRDSQFPLRS